MSMKHYLLCVLIVLTSTAAAAPKNTKWVDASTLTIINKAQTDTVTWQRIDTTRYDNLTKTAATYLSFSTGIAVTFRTDSRNIYARWTTSGRKPAANNTLINQSGLDMYIMHDGKWTFAGTGSPKSGKTRQEAPVACNMTDSVKECVLYLPLFDTVKDLQIGIDPGATIEKAPGLFNGRIAVIGSSITHGSSASRPGMTYPARLGRAFGMETINIGLSGQCKLDKFFSDIAGDTEADLFIFDTFSNPTPEQIEERLRGFVKAVRKAHPDTPLIFLQTEVRETGNFDLKKRELESNKRATAERIMNEIIASGERNIYFINPGMPIGGDHEATVDGVHPTDLGFTRILEHIQPRIEEIIRSRGIK